MSTVFVIIGIVLALLILILAIAIVVLFRYTFIRKSDKQLMKERWTPEGDHRLAPYADKVHAAEHYIDFTLHRTLSLKTADGLIIRARYYPIENAKGTVVMMHGYRSSMKYDVGLMVETVQKLGYTVLLPSQRSHETSEGVIITFGARESEDCAAWVAEAHRLAPEDDIFLYGVSMGAATVMLTTAKDLPENVRGYIADCGYTSGADIIKRSAIGMIKNGYYLVNKPIMGMYKQATKLDIDESDCTAAVAKSKLPALFICGEDDDFVPLEMTMKNYEAAAGEKRLLTVPGAVHATSCLVDPERYTKELSDFLEKYRTKK